VDIRQHPPITEPGSRRAIVPKTKAQNGRTMAEPIAFLSFDVASDRTDRDHFVQKLNESKVALSIEDSSPRGELPVWDSAKLLTGKIGRCQMMIVLVGQQAAHAQGIAQEITVAKSRNVPYFGIYVDSADENTELPEGLARDRVLPWDWRRIEEAITQLSAEGKNHTFI
jgi:hypothetical protein